MLSIFLNTFLEINSLMFLTDSVQHTSIASTMYSGQAHLASSFATPGNVHQHGTRQVTLQLPSGDFGDDLKRMNAERVKLDEELRDKENKEIKIFVDEFVSNFTMLISVSFCLKLYFCSCFGLPYNQFWPSFGPFCL